MEYHWRRKTIEEIDALWAELEFTSSFWHCPGNNREIKKVTVKVLQA